MLVLVFVGASIAVASWAAVFLTGLAVVRYHVRIPAEERACVARCGASYRAYLERVPRSFIFF